MFFEELNDLASKEIFVFVESFIPKILKLLNLMWSANMTLKSKRQDNFLSKLDPDESEIQFEDWEDEGLRAPS